MEEFTRKVENNLSVPGLPKFKTKEEIISNARQRLASKRGAAASRIVQGGASASSNTENTVRLDQGSSRGSTADSSGTGTERGPQTYSIHGGNGRDEIGARGSNGHFDDVAISDRINANGRTGLDQYDGPASRVSESEIYATKTGRSASRNKVGGVRSKMKSFVDTAFAPIQDKTSKTSGSIRSKATYSPGKKTTWRPLTEGEAEELRPKLVIYLTWQSEHLDNLIIATVAGHDPNIQIWGDMDEAEIEILSDFLISLGKNDPKTAQAVRFASTIIDRVKAGLIVIPRMYRTANLYLSRGFDFQIFIKHSR